MESSREQLVVLRASLTRTARLVALVFTGLLLNVLSRLDSFFEETGRELGKADDVSPVWAPYAGFRRALLLVRLIRMKLSDGVGLGRRISVPGNRIASSLDDFLVG